MKKMIVCSLLGLSLMFVGCGNKTNNEIEKPTETVVDIETAEVSNETTTEETTEEVSVEEGSYESRILDVAFVDSALVEIRTETSGVLFAFEKEANKFLMNTTIENKDGMTLVKLNDKIYSTDNNTYWYELATVTEDEVFAIDQSASIPLEILVLENTKVEKTDENTVVEGSFEITGVTYDGILILDSEDKVISINVAQNGINIVMSPLDSDFNFDEYIGDVTQYTTVDKETETEILMNQLISLTSLTGGIRDIIETGSETEVIENTEDMVETVEPKMGESIEN